MSLALFRSTFADTCRMVRELYALDVELWCGGGGCAR